MDYETSSSTETNNRYFKQIAFELASRSMDINATTLPDILKNAETIYQWLMK